MSVKMRKYNLIIHGAIKKACDAVAQQIQLDAKRNTLSMSSKSAGSTGARQEIADSIVLVSTGDAKSDRYSTSVFIDYGNSLSWGSLAHLFEFGFRLTTAFYARNRKTPIDIPKKPFMRPAFLEARDDFHEQVRIAVARAIK